MRSPFPLSEANPPEHPGAARRAAEVVVIGGGVIGVTTALFLARAGVSVVLLEKGRIAGEQSSRNWGWIRVQGAIPAEIPIAQEAQGLWPALAAEVDTDIGLTQGGVAYLAQRRRPRWRDFEAWMARRPRLRRVDPAARRAKASPAVCRTPRQRWAGALWTPTDMRAEPFVTVPALARLAAARRAR